MNSEKLYNLLIQQNIIGSKGTAFFHLQGLNIPIKDKSVFGNLIQEWLTHFMKKHKITARFPNNSQEFPDVYLNPISNTEDLLEIKCFTKSPNFDIANFQAYTRSLLSDAYRLDANYLIFEYKMLETELIIENIWLKKVWEISCGSERSPIKIQWKQGVPINIRPATWYAKKTAFPVFASCKHFVLALKQVIDMSPQCENIRKDWIKKVSELYRQQTGKVL